jgi:hypothetical protein
MGLGPHVGRKEDRRECTGGTSGRPISTRRHHGQAHGVCRPGAAGLELGGAGRGTERFVSPGGGRKIAAVNRFVIAALMGASSPMGTFGESESWLAESHHRDTCLLRLPEIS